MANPLPTPADVRNALYDQGTSLMAWAAENDFNYNTVQGALDRHLRPHQTTQPRGLQTRAILRRLGETLQIQLLA